MLCWMVKKKTDTIQEAVLIDVIISAKEVGVLETMGFFTGIIISGEHIQYCAEDYISFYGKPKIEFYYNLKEVSVKDFAKLLDVAENKLPYIYRDCSIHNQLLKINKI